MPLFEYECLECGTRFEQLIYNKNADVTCRSCGSTRVTMLLSTFAVAGTSDRPAPDLGPCASCGAAQRGACGIE